MSLNHTQGQSGSFLAKVSMADCLQLDKIQTETKNRIFQARVELVTGYLATVETVPRIVLCASEHCEATRPAKMRELTIPI